MLDAYQKEQLEGFCQVQAFLSGLPAPRFSLLRADIQPYLAFRARLDRFLDAHFSKTCIRACYQSNRSACCSKDGIITFFADVLINVLSSDRAQQSRLLRALHTPHQGQKCLYLTREGCIWRVKPLICALFLCDSAKKDVFQQDVTLAAQWDALNQESRMFKWPDRPVLFDRLEAIAVEAGFKCSLMYFHTSPGLLRIKQRAGLVSTPPDGPSSPLKQHSLHPPSAGRSEMGKRS